MLVGGCTDGEKWLASPGGGTPEAKMILILTCAILFKILTHHFLRSNLGWIETKQPFAGPNCLSKPSQPFWISIPKEAEEAEREQRLVEEALAKREAEEARKAAEEQEQERRKAEEVPLWYGRWWKIRGEWQRKVCDVFFLGGDEDFSSLVIVCLHM